MLITVLAITAVFAGAGFFADRSDRREARARLDAKTRLIYFDGRDGDRLAKPISICTPETIARIFAHRNGSYDA